MSNTGIRLTATCLAAFVLCSWFAQGLQAQSISVTAGQYSTRTNYEVNWRGTYSLGGVATYTIQTYIRPSTSPNGSQGTASWFQNNRTGYGTTDPSAPGSYAFGRLGYMVGSSWYYVDSNVLYIDSPWN